MDQAVHTSSTSVEDKRILITGGTTGIGRAVAEMLVASGGLVFTFGRDKQDLAKALDALRAEGGRAEGVVADVTRAEDISRVFAAVDEAFGGVDVLVANAAVPADGILQMTDAEWRYAIEANLVGYLACVKQAASRMVKAGSGHIVLVGSMSAEVHEKGSSVYVAAKSGVRGFAVSLRKEVNGRGVKVTLIEPGAVSTDMASPSPDDQRRMIEEGTMLLAEDIAACIYFALTQPWRSDIISMQVRPHRQEI